VDDDSTSYMLEDGVLYSNATYYGTPFKEKYVDYCLKNLKNINIRNDAHRINTYAFYNSSLESITIPSTITNVFPYICQNCQKLKTVIWESSYKMPYYGFENCKSLESIDINCT
jgi:hypothetical protein